MRIGVLGAGNMATALGGRWAASGHDVLISSRDPESAVIAAREIGAGVRGGTFRDAVSFGRVTLVAVPADAVLEVLAGIGAGSGSLDQQVVIDCCNPIDVSDEFNLTTADQPSLANRVAGASPGALVVKAFNLCASTVWADPGFGQGRYVPLCGDDPEARDLVGGLVRDLGWGSLDLGGLDRAGQLEAVAALGIRLLTRRIGLESILPLDQPAPE
jgi:predicted dinucleotide-binding enzyme